MANQREKFLLTPLREGRRGCGSCMQGSRSFLLTPLREGRHKALLQDARNGDHFYSRPCGRGDADFVELYRRAEDYFYSRPCGRGDA